MADFLLDTFNVSGPLALESHTPDTGGVWSTGAAGTATITTSSHKLRAAADVASVGTNFPYSNAATPAAADWTLDVSVKAETNDSFSEAIRVFFRYVDTSNFYMAVINDLGSFILYKCVGGAYTSLASTTVTAPVAGSTTSLKIYGVGTAISASWGATVITATDSAFSAAGKAAIAFLANSGKTDSNRFNALSIHGYTGSGSTAYTLTAAKGTFVETGIAATLTKNGVSPGSIAVTDTNVFFSPYNWLAGSGFKRSCHPGAYIKLAVTGTTTFALTVDNTDLNAIAGIISAGYPELSYRVNTGAIVTVQLASGVTTPINLSGLTGTTQIKIWLKSVNHNYNAYTAAANSVKVTGFTVDNGGTTTALTADFAIRPKTMIAYGDSIICGYYAVNNASDMGSDSTYSYIRFIADVFNAEVGIVGIGGQGINAPGNMGFPACYNSTDASNQAYQYHISGQSRLSGGLLSPVPDYAWLAHGANDSAGSPFQTSYAAFLVVLRTICGASAQIYSQVPFGGNARTQIVAAIAASTDSKLTKVDCGTIAQIGCDNSSPGTATYKTTDNIHLNTRGHAEMGTRAAYIAGGSGTTVNNYYLVI